MLLLTDDFAEGLSWLRRGESGDRAALREDAELLRERRALFTPHVANITLYVHTSEVHSYYDCLFVGALYFWEANSFY